MSDLARIKQTKRPGSNSMREQWIVKGPHGAIEFWREPVPEEFLDSRDSPYYGGVEKHSAGPLSDGPLYEGHDTWDTPSHTDCELTPDGVCFHDGSSSWASEHFIPLSMLPGCDGYIFWELESAYRCAFESADEEVHP